MKPDKPIVYNEFYLDAMTGGSPELPAPVTPEQHYLAHLAGMTVTLPQPIILRDMFLAKICGMDVDIPTYIPGEIPSKIRLLCQSRRARRGCSSAYYQRRNVLV